LNEYETIAVTTRDGITELRFHTANDSLVWTATAHREAGVAFAEVAADPATKVVIVTGTGDVFCVEFDAASFVGQVGWESAWWEGKRLLKGLLDIDVPVIGVVNGPATLHAEIPLLADIVIASETAVFADTHFATGFVPGDGVHLVWPYLLGARRAKYFLMTGQEIHAAEALRLGIVNEVVAPGKLQERAYELASDWAAKPVPLLRYTREALNIYEREQLLNGLSHGLTLEGLGVLESKTFENSPTTAFG
jgi:enoyl-CoA hydratase/carnithine racemase